MTQEEKALLLKDLCVRLPYGIKCAEVYPDNKFVNKWDIVKISKFIEDGIFISNCEETYGYVSQIENIKSYLFPLSSMTEEQKIEYSALCYEEEKECYECGEWVTRVYLHNTIESIDWCNKNHFDYRDLIEKGLALDATGLNIY